mgnify:CR=1 FL=1
MRYRYASKWVGAAEWRHKDGRVAVVKETEQHVVWPPYFVYIFPTGEFLRAASREDAAFQLVKLGFEPVSDD